MPVRTLLLSIVALAAFLPAAYGRPDRFEAARRHMVDEFIEAEGVEDARVLQAMRDTPRHEFVLPAEVRLAYADAALPIGHAQTISPPFVVAYMTQTIDPQPADKVLEIGTGSGYQAAVLSPLVKEVYSVEIVEELSRDATRRLAKLGYENVHTKAGDGFKGWPEHAPFDKIIVTCSPEKVPQPLVDQLAEGGKLLIPLGERYQQVFYLFEKREGRLAASKLIPTLFVPMTGESEERRLVQPDGVRPQLLNGGFEEDADANGRPDHWHYLRQASLVEGGAPGGERLLSVSNADPGRLAQALQGFALDGRKVGAVSLSASLRAEKIVPGRDRSETPGVVLILFDQNRKSLGVAGLSPPRDPGWTTRRRTVAVPPQTREAILAVTLAGGVGTLEADDVSITTAPR